MIDQDLREWFLIQQLFAVGLVSWADQLQSSESELGKVWKRKKLRLNVEKENNILALGREELKLQAEVENNVDMYMLWAHVK